MSRAFYTIQSFETKSKAYSLLPFRYRQLGGEELLVNEVGEYVTAPTGTVQSLTRGVIDKNSELYKTLKSRHFVFDSASSSLLDILATKYRTKKSFMNGFAKLHIFVVTLRCDHSCHYCQVSRQTSDRTAFDMSESTAERSLQILMRAPSKRLTLEFQGGEPLLAFDRIQDIVRRAKDLAAAHDKEIEFVIVTNLAYATDTVLSYCRDHQIKLSTSLDGPAFLHNTNRPRPGNNSHEITISNLQRAREIVGPDNVAALMTTTRLSLDYPIEIIDEYIKYDFRSIFLRPISPYGFAVKTHQRTGYDMSRFLQFYKRALDYIIELNRRGIDFQEVYAKIILTKILTPYPTGYVDLQSPNGAGIGTLVYNYDGNLYASDEARMLAEMQDTTFKLGNVHSHTYEEIVKGPEFQRLLSAACNETLPGCVDCAFQPYCGADPVFHHATQGDLIGHRPSSSFCMKNMTIIDYLFSLLQANDRQLLRIFFTWIRDQGLNDMALEVPG